MRDFDGGIVLAKFFGVPEEEVHVWSDGSYTLGYEDVQDYYVLPEDVIFRDYDLFADFTASDGERYSIYSNRAAPYVVFEDVNDTFGVARIAGVSATEIATGLTKTAAEELRREMGNKQ